MDVRQTVPPISRRDELRNALRFERDPIGFLRGEQERVGDLFRFSDSVIVAPAPG